jgi:hypothetical protein
MLAHLADAMSPNGDRIPRNGAAMSLSYSCDRACAGDMLQRMNFSAVSGPKGGNAMNTSNKGFSLAWKAMLLLAAAALVSAPARAGLVSTEQVVQQSEREKVESFLQREGVERELKALGVSPELARDRAKALTDEEVHALAGKIDTLAAGGALATTDWLLIIIAILLLIVVL